MDNFTPPIAKRGFGLVELMVILAIVGVLVAVGMPAYQTYITQARVSEALLFADGNRIQVDLALLQGRTPAADLLNSTGKKVDALTALTWVPNPASPAGSSSGSGSQGYILASMDLPGIGVKNALALQRMADGIWVCVSAAKVGQKDALEEKYLPSSCHGNGTALAVVPAVPTCPPDQDMISLNIGGKDTSACVAKCPAGQTRDSANPSQCKEVVCGPNERKHGNSGLCVSVGLPPDCGTTGDAHISYSYDNTPSWNCFPKCDPGKLRDAHNWFNCIPDPNLKPVAPVGAATKPAVPVASPPAVPVASVKCRSCTAGVEDLCELVHEEITCKAPNNYCITFIDNQADGTKIVKRGCGDYNRVHTEWYQGTSDDDKCRERINTQQNLEFNCTFGCTTDNCNDNLRPAEDTLYQPK